VALSNQGFHSCLRLFFFSETGSHYIAQIFSSWADVIFLPQSPCIWGSRCVPLCLALPKKLQKDVLEPLVHPTHCPPSLFPLQATGTKYPKVVPSSPVPAFVLLHRIGTHRKLVPFCVTNVTSMVSHWIYPSAPYFFLLSVTYEIYNIDTFLSGLFLYPCCSVIHDRTILQFVYA
jgi:hypothetical protein